MKRVLKRWLSIIFVLNLLLIDVSGAEAAGSKGQEFPMEEAQLPQGGVRQIELIPLDANADSKGIQPFSSGEYDRDGAIQAIYSGTSACRETLFVSDYYIPKSEFGKLWSYITHWFGELFHIKACYYDESNGLITRIYPIYTVSSTSEYFSAKEKLYKKIDEIIGKMEPTFTDMEKVLFVHDYLVANFEYDTDYNIYDALHFLTTGKGVCEAYTLTFESIMDRLEIPVSYVLSSNLMHIWNMVQVGGKWYQLDITHDDPVTDRLGAVEHTHFLVSDGKMKEIKGVTESDCDWAYGTSAACTDTSYEDRFWTEVSSPFIYDQQTSSWYYVSSGEPQSGLSAWNGEDGDQLIAEVEDLSGWTSCPAGLAVYYGNLYFSAADGVYRYDMETNALTSLVETPDYSSRIFGMKISGSKLYYDYRTYNPGSRKLEKTIRTIELPSYTDVDGIYSWYADNETVKVYIPKGTTQPTLTIAWYSGNRLVKSRICSTPGNFTSRISDDRRCKIMALSRDNYRPLCEAVTVNPAA